MKFNIDETLKEMLAVMRAVAKEHWKDMESVSTNFFNRKKERLEMLAKMRISGEITQARFESRLEDEKLILEAELNAIAVLSKAITQKAINGAIDVLEKAVTKAVGAIL